MDIKIVDGGVTSGKIDVEFNMNNYRNNSNRGLFWYGIRAKLKQAFGGLLIWLGFIFGIIIGVATHNMILGIIIIVLIAGLGFYMIATGSSQRFDFQRQSGQIIHRGDW